jgi:hypothetical protein
LGDLFEVSERKNDARCQNRLQGEDLGNNRNQSQSRMDTPFFSSERAKKDRIKLKQKKSSFNPDDLIKRIRGQFRKYHETYNMNYDQVFVLLPSLAFFHRKRFDRKIANYLKNFKKNSGLPESNLILLSNNLSLDLSPIKKGKKYEPTGLFEKVIQSLVKMTAIDFNQLRGNSSSEGS